MDSISFIVPGQAVGKPAPRFNRTTGRTYTPSHGADWMARVQQAAMPKAPPEPWDGPVEVVIEVERLPLRSFSRVKAAAALGGALRPTSRPDCDNYSKGVCDALSGLVFVDDAQVVDLVVCKRYGVREQTTVTVRRLGGVGREAGGELGASRATTTGRGDVSTPGLETREARSKRGAPSSSEVGHG